MVAWDRIIYHVHIIIIILHNFVLLCGPGLLHTLLTKKMFALRTPDVKLVIWVASMGNCKSLPTWATVKLTHLLIPIYSWVEHSQVSALTKICKCMAVGCCSATVINTQPCLVSSSWSHVTTMLSLWGEPLSSLPRCPCPHRHIHTHPTHHHHQNSINIT